MDTPWWHQVAQDAGEALQYQKVLSVSANADWDMTVYSRAGVVAHSSPNNLINVNQSLTIDEKIKATGNPGSIVDVDVTSGSVKVKLTENISLFGSIDGGTGGVAIKMSGDQTPYEYIEDKYSVGMTKNGPTVTTQREGITVDTENTEENYEIKLMQRHIRRISHQLIFLSLVILSGCSLTERNPQYPLDEITAPGDLNPDLAQVQITLSRKIADQTVGYITTLDRSDPIEFTLGNRGRELNVSPDRTLVVYSFTETIEDELRSSLWLHDLNSGEDKRLVLWPDKLYDISLSSPNFYPDGGKLIFSITYYETDTTSLGSIGLDGANLELIDTPIRTLSTGPIVSPNGEKILVLCEGVDKDSGQPGFMLCIMDADGSHRFRLVQDGDYHGTYLFTPDSQAIIYSESERRGLLGLVNPPRYEIKRIDVNGKNEGTILEWHRAVNVMALSEDGTEIIFLDRYEEGKLSSLYLIDADGKNLRHLAYFDEFLAEWYASD